jgi:hypothetical protein
LGLCGLFGIECDSVDDNGVVDKEDCENCDNVKRELIEWGY